MTVQSSHPSVWSALCLGVLAACGPARPADARTGAIRAVVTAHLATVQVTRVTASVSPGGVMQDLQLDAGMGAFTGMLTVPAGLQTVTVEAFSGTARVGTGSAQVQVVRGETAQVSITLRDLTGPAPVPDHAPVVTLAVPRTTLQVGESQALVATAFDQDGDAIALSWSAAPTGCAVFSAPASATTSMTAAFPGACRVEVTATAAGKSDTQGADLAFTPAPAGGLRWAYPLRASPNGRYLVDQTGKPFRIHGEAAWSAIANLTAAEQGTYLADRAARGTNIVLVNLFEHFFAQNAPNLVDGTPPFTSSGQFATVSAAYLAAAQAFVDKAAGQGMAVLLVPMYLGFNGGNEGWWSVLTAPSNTQTVCFNLGMAIGSAFKDRPNVLWAIGGDYLPPAGSEGEARLHKIMEGIKAAGAAQPWTAHWAPDTVSTQSAAFATDLQFTAAYSQGDPLTYARNAYAAAPRPAFLIETRYENEGNGRAVVRDSMWRGLLGSAGGAIFGTNPIWPFNAAPGFRSSTASPFDTWEHTLVSPGSLDWQRTGALLDELSWWNLAPEGVSGAPTVRSAGGTAAAVSPAGDLALVWLGNTGTTAQSVTIRSSAMAAPFRAQWWNPTSGAKTVDSTPNANAGTKTFTSPGDNGTGANDWALLLDIPGAPAAAVVGTGTSRARATGAAPR